MNKFKKSISLLLVAVMILPLGTFAFGEETDISNHWAKEEVQYLMGKEVVSGYSDGNFKPDQSITRAEFFKVINNVFGYSKKGKVQFTDVKDGDWFYDEVAKAVAAGYAGGYDDGTMKPNKPITRQEASKVISVAFGLDGDKSKSAKDFEDNSLIPDWAKDYVGILKDKGYLSGYSDGTFRPKNEITRAEVSKIITNASGNIINSEGQYSKDVVGNVLVNTPNVSLKGMHIKGDLYLAEGIKEGDIDLNNVVVDGQIYIRGEGKNTINVKNSKLGKVVIKEAENDVNLVLEGDTKVSSIVADNNTKLAVKEGVVVESIKVAGKSNIEVAKGAEVGKLEVEAKDTEIKSEGKIESIVSTEDVKVNDKEVKKGTEIKVENGKVKEVKKDTKPTPAPSTGGGGGGGRRSSGGSSRDDDDDEVAVTGVSVSPKTMTLTVGKTGKITATVKPDNATNKKVNWTTSDESIATVANGVVTAKAAGTATITATSDANSSKKDSCVVTVKAEEELVSAISVTTDKTEYKVGEELDLSSLVLTVEYDNNTSEVINVTMDMVSGFDSSKPGTLEVTVTYKGKIATFTVNIVEEGPVVVTGELVGSENYPGYENWKDAITSEGIDFSKITKAQAIKMGINDPDYYGIALDLKVNGEVVELNTANLSKVERVKPNGEIETPIVTAEGTVQFVHDGWGETGEYTMRYTLTDGTVVEVKINVVSFEFKGEIPTTYTVTFDSKGGSAVEAITVEEGETITLPEAPTKEGYTFVGWFMDDEYTTEFTADTAITEDIIVYAKWEVLISLPLPSNAVTEVEVRNVDELRFLVAGVTMASEATGEQIQYPLSAEETITKINEMYEVTINLDGLRLEDGVVKVDNSKSFMSPEDWNKIKDKGNKEIPYSITLVNKYAEVGKWVTADQKVLKVQFYQDGQAGLFDMQEPEETDTSAPVVTVSGAPELLKQDDESFNLTFEVEDESELKRLEIDHSLEGLLPEFKLYPYENPWRSHESDDTDAQARKEAAASYGLSATYDETTTTWTLTFGEGEALTKIKEQTEFRIYYVVEDIHGNKYGSMDPTGPSNTIVIEVEAPPLAELVVSNAAHDADNKTIAYTFNAEFKLVREFGEPWEIRASELSDANAGLFQIFLLDEGFNYDHPNSVRGEVKGVAWDEDTNTITLTYEGDLEPGTYLVDTWGYTIANLDGVAIDKENLTEALFTVEAPVDEGEDLVELLTRAKGYSNWPDTPEKGNFADLGTSITVEGTTVTADLSGHTETIEGIMEKPDIDEAIEHAFGEEAKVDFETVSRYYINNTLSRYLAALYRVDNTPVASIKYKDVTYTWNPGDNDNGKGSKWMPTEGEGASLLKAIVTDNEEGITSVEFTLVKENEVSIDVTFVVTAPEAPVLNPSADFGFTEPDELVEGEDDIAGFSIKVSNVANIGDDVKLRYLMEVVDGSLDDKVIGYGADPEVGTFTIKDGQAYFGPSVGFVLAEEGDWKYKLPALKTDEGVITPFTVKGGLEAGTYKFTVSIVAVEEDDAKVVTSEIFEFTVTEALTDPVEAALAELNAVADEAGMWAALVALAEVSELDLTRDFSNKEDEAPEMNVSIGDFVFQNVSYKTEGKFATVADVQKAVDDAHIWFGEIRTFVGNAINGTLTEASFSAMDGALETMAEAQGVNKDTDDEYKDVKALIASVQAFIGAEDDNLALLNTAISEALEGKENKFSRVVVMEALGTVLAELQAEEPVVKEMQVTPETGATIEVDGSIVVTAEGADDLRIMLWAEAFDTVDAAKAAYADKVFSSRTADLIAGGMQITNDGEGTFTITINEDLITMLKAGTRFESPGPSTDNYTWSAGEETTWLITPETDGLLWEEYATWNGEKVEDSLFVYTLGVAEEEPAILEEPGVSPEDNANIEGVQGFTFGFKSVTAKLDELRLDIYLDNTGDERNYNDAIQLNLPANQQEINNLIDGAISNWDTIGLGTQLLLKAAGYDEDNESSKATVKENIKFDTTDDGVSGVWSYKFDTAVFEAEKIEFLVEVKDTAGAKWGNSNYTKPEKGEVKAFQYNVILPDDSESKVTFQFSGFEEDLTTGDNEVSITVKAEKDAIDANQLVRYRLTLKDTNGAGVKDVVAVGKVWNVKVVTGEDGIAYFGAEGHESVNGYLIEKKDEAGFPFSHIKAAAESAGGHKSDFTVSGLLTGKGYTLLIEMVEWDRAEGVGAVLGSETVKFNVEELTIRPIFSLGSEEEVNASKAALNITDAETITGTETQVQDYSNFIGSEEESLKKGEKYVLGLKVVVEQPAADTPITFGVEATEGVNYYLKDTEGNWYKNTPIWGPGTTTVNNELYGTGVTSPVFVEVPAEFDGDQVFVTIKMYETANPDNVFGTGTFTFNVEDGGTDEGEE